MAAPVVHVDQARTDAATTNSQSSPSSPLNGLEERPIVDSESPLQDFDARSTYHIYKQDKLHALITPTVDPARERFWGPKSKEVKEAKQKQKEFKAALENDGLVHAQQASDDGAFFLHTPYLAFHEPPRVLYIGSTKHAVPAVLIHCFYGWRKWKLQLGPSLAQPGVLDRRGVVCWKHNGGDRKALKKDDTLLKGYKVRTWRLWGESGKAYVKSIKANRRAGIGPDPDDTKNGEIPHEEASEQQPNVSTSYKHNAPARAERVVYLKWKSPLSRRYHFQFAGIDFYWKGTGTVKEKRTCGFFCRFEHLKLVARLPPEEECKKGKKARREVCLGTFTSSVAEQKLGTLELFDGVIWRFASECMPSVLVPVIAKSAPANDGLDADSVIADVSTVKKTLLYQVIVATAMCMVIGEQEKRETAKRIVAAAREGGGGGGG